MEAYQVSSIPTNATGNKSDTQKFRTQALSATVKGLALGQRYTFYVKALWGGGRGGGEASVQATPVRPCNFPHQPQVGGVFRWPQQQRVRLRGEPEAGTI